METTSTLSDRSPAKAGGAHPIVGQIDCLDAEGNVGRTWRLTRPRCTIGSSEESLVCIDDHSMAPVHALIVFGRNHTLIRSLGGQVRIAGRSVREWLIDEPTLIQCGATRCLVYPTGKHVQAKQIGHQVTAGSLADQAARLKANGSVEAEEMAWSQRTGSNSNPRPHAHETLTPANLQGEFFSLPPQSTLPATPFIAKLDPKEITAALEPLHRAILAASDGISALARRADESNAAEAGSSAAERPASEITQAIDAIETRVSSITDRCETLLLNLSESLEGRIHRLDDFLAQLAVTSSLAATRPVLQDEEPLREATPLDETSDNSFRLQLIPDRPNAPEQAQATSSWFSHSVDEPYVRPEPDDPSASFDRVELYADHLESFDREESLDGSPRLAGDDRPEDTDDLPVKAELPAWFTQDPQHALEEGWSTAELNPIYAEDSNRWLAEAESTDERSISAIPPDEREEMPAEESEAIESQGEDAVDANLDIPYSESEFDDSRLRMARLDEEDVEESLAYEEPSEPYAEAEEEAFAENGYVGPSADETAESEGAGEVDREESIEEYMARLLERVRGGPGSEPNPLKAVSPLPKKTERPTAPAVEMEASASYADPSTPTAKEEPLSLPPMVSKPVESPTGEMGPKKSAPERATDLAVLRNLANSTARQAIQKSSRKRIELNLVSKIAISLLGLGGAILLLVLNGLNANVAMIGMIASFVVFLLWGYEAVVQIRQLQIAKATEASEFETA